VQFDKNTVVETDFQTIVDSIPQIVWVTRGDGFNELFSRRWYEYTGLTAAESHDDGWGAVLHPDDLARTEELWQQSLATGDPFDIEYRFRRHDGVFRWFFGSARALRDATGTVVRWFGTLTDIDERIAAEQTLTFLLDASEALGGGLDLDERLDALARTIAPRLAEWCLIYMCAPNGDLTLRAIAHDNAELVQRVRDRLAHEREPFLGETVEMVMRTGASLLVPATVERLPGADVMLEHALGISSATVVPLRTGGEVIGALQLINSASGRAVTDDQRRIAEALAARAAIALDNARLFERERQIARTFQNAALPATLPNVRGVVLDASYEAASSEALVGGDWYDALRLRDGRVVLSIGDVAGHGLAAAVTMQAMRQAVRTVAHVFADPIMILDAADRTLRNESPDRIVTAFVGIYDAIEGEFRYALAGHPPPLVRRADGSVVTLESPGLPLGLRENSTDDGHAIPLGAGDLVVLYTDGVLEATRDVLEGERLLKDAVARNGDDPRYAAHRIVAHAIPQGAFDDVAVLTLGVSTAATAVRGCWSFATDDAAGAAHANAEYLDCLRAYGISDPALFYAARTVFGEMIGNAVRHAGGTIEIVFEARTEPVLHVLDRGGGFVLAPYLPSDVLAERGRGLYLVWCLTNEFNVSRRTKGGSHARAVLRTR